jgi:hypothetical protein
MMNTAMLFILIATGFYIKQLSFPVQMEMQYLNHYCSQSKIPASQYRKKLTIWELGKNRFT